jgi:hypothetical protein
VMRRSRACVERSRIAISTAHAIRDDRSGLIALRAAEMGLPDISLFETSLAYSSLRGRLSLWDRDLCSGCGIAVRTTLKKNPMGPARAMLLAVNRARIDTEITVV